MLVKQLDDLDGKMFDTSQMLDGLPTVIPTVGIDFKELNVRQTKVVVREVGSAVMPLWPSQVNEGCNKVMFMIDLSNRYQVSASCVQLLTVLSSEHLVNKQIAILLNKCDSPGAMSTAEISSMLRLDDIMKTKPANQQLTVLTISAARRRGLEPLMDWMLS